MSLFRTMPSAGDFAPLFRLLDDYDVHRSNRGQVSSLRSFTPRFDVRESDDAYHLDGELPGISQENIDIEFSDRHTLVISGRTERIHDTPQSQDVQGKNRDVVKAGEQSVTKSENNKHRYWVSERSVGEFHRTFSFPDKIDQDKVKASLKNGILSVVVPKETASGVKKITIE
ncbi:30 kDa heat shock protein [Aspergillus cristatus]|uniref:30 kDa heat shock protein n=1 Tax=Aspergillus cristatus TaxID=573508 RepID=A0A1E3BLV9_ASPCR|nr:30 kDa heat shock protein [Aspergillus cristatus]